jgi:flagellar motor switch protein FliG
MSAATTEQKPAAPQSKLGAARGGYNDVRSLRGIQKCAVLMVALGEDKAAEIFKHLSQTEVEALSLEIAKAPKVPSDVVKGVITEAVETVLAEDYLAEGGVDYARSLLQKSLGA